MILLGDCLERLKELEDNSVDSVVTDPPWALKFMNKKWDYSLPSVDVWREVLRVLRPGGHALVCCGTRTQHRMVVNVEDAGFEIRDVVVHLYGSGFPKSLNIQKSARSSGLACDCESSPEHDLQFMPGPNVQATVSTQEAVGGVLQSGVSEQGSHGAVLRAESEKGTSAREKSSLEGRGYLQTEQGELHRAEVCPVSRGFQDDGSQGRLHNGTPPSNGETFGSDAESSGSCASQGPQYEKQQNKKSGTISEQPSTQACGRCGKAIVDPGLGTALKPAAEFWTLARKPLEKGLTVAQNFLKWGVGGLNIDASRIGTEQIKIDHKTGNSNSLSYKDKGEGPPKFSHSTFVTGRWPANLILDETAAERLDEQSGTLKSGTPGIKSKGKDGAAYGVESRPPGTQMSGFADSGGASRFFYCAKASKSERNAGLEGMPEKPMNTYNFSEDGSFTQNSTAKTGEQVREARQNFHPTVKPIKLMEYLIKLITPPNGTVLDPFMGSGSTGVAAFKSGFKFIGIEMNPEYVEIAEKRIKNV